VVMFVAYGVASPVKKMGSIPDLTSK